MTTQKIHLHALNAVVRIIALWSTYYAYSHLPMGVAASIGYTGPMISIILAMFLLKERVVWQQWVAVIIGYGGILVMVNPENAELNMAVGVALLANLGASLSQITTKTLTKTDSMPKIVFYGNFFSMLIAAIVSGYQWVTPTREMLPLLLGAAVLGTCSQISYIKALECAPVSVLAPFEYLKLLFVIPLGYFLFAEIFTDVHLLGCGIILACSLYLTWRESRAVKEVSSLS
jgi:drug/metabolite transporter (DMT)-like permease